MIKTICKLNKNIYMHMSVCMCVCKVYHKSMAVFRFQLVHVNIY